MRMMTAAVHAPLIVHVSVYVQRGTVSHALVGILEKTMMISITRLECEHLLACLQAAQDGSAFLMEEEIEQGVEILEALLR